jgi:RNA polymerase sigma-70 factor (ECF subfamily)
MENIYSLLQHLCVTEYETDAESDRELAHRVRSGEREGFDLVFEIYNRPLYRYAYRLLKDEDAALDAVQDAFVRLLGYREKIEEEKGMKTLLFTITNNLCLDRLRKHSRRGEQSLEQKESDTFFQGSDTRFSPEQETINRELVTAVNRAIDTLPAKLRTAVLLRQEVGMTFTEVGASLGVSDRYAKKMLRQALDRMALFLKKEGYHDTAREGSDK